MVLSPSNVTDGGHNWGTSCPWDPVATATEVSSNISSARVTRTSIQQQPAVPRWGSAVYAGEGTKTQKVNKEGEGVALGRDRDQARAPSHTTLASSGAQWDLAPASARPTTVRVRGRVSQTPQDGPA